MNSRRWLGLVVRFDCHAAAVLADALVLHVAGDKREQRVVAAEADARARRDPGSALADDDGAGVDRLAGVDLHPEHLRVRVATVAGRAASLLVRHYFSSFALALAAALVARGLRAAFLAGLSSSASRFSFSAALDSAALALPKGRISRAVRSARAPRCTRTRFFDL